MQRGQAGKPDVQGLPAPLDKYLARLAPCSLSSAFEKTARTLYYFGSAELEAISRADFTFSLIRKRCANNSSAIWRSMWPVASSFRRKPETGFPLPSCWITAFAGMANNEPVVLKASPERLVHLGGRCAKVGMYPSKAACCMIHWRRGLRSLFRVAQPRIQARDIFRTAGWNLDPEVM